MSRFISEMVQDRAVVTMECEWEPVPKLSNGTIFNDLEGPVTQISRCRSLWWTFIILHACCL